MASSGVAPPHPPSHHFSHDPYALPTPAEEEAEDGKKEIQYSNPIPMPNEVGRKTPSPTPSAATPPLTPPLPEAPAEENSDEGEGAKSERPTSTEGSEKQPEQNVPSVQALMEGAMFAEPKSPTNSPAPYQQERLPAGLNMRFWHSKAKSYVEYDSGDVMVTNGSYDHHKHLVRHRCQWYSRQTCHNFASGTCPFGRECNYIHAVGEAKLVIPAVKVKMTGVSGAVCFPVDYIFSTTGACEHLDGKNQDRHLITLCDSFRRPEGCPKGEECEKAHSNYPPNLVDLLYRRTTNEHMGDWKQRLASFKTQPAKEGVKPTGEEAQNKPPTPEADQQPAPQAEPKPEGEEVLEAGTILEMYDDSIGLVGLVPSHLVYRTTGSEMLLEATKQGYPLGREMCKSHQLATCQWGADCGFIHVVGKTFAAVNAQTYPSTRQNARRGGRGFGGRGRGGAGPSPFGYGGRGRGMGRGRFMPPADHTA